MYTSENLQAMGSVYAQLTQLKGFNDTFKNQCDMFPMRSITTMIKRMDTVFEIKNKKLKRTDYYA